MLEQLQNPLFPVFILFVVVLIGYVVARPQLLPASIFLLFASMGVVVDVTGIGQIGMFRAILAPILIVLLVVARIRQGKPLPFLYWALIAILIVVYYVAGTINHVPFADYRGSLGMTLLAVLVSLAPVREKTYRYFMIAVAVWGLVNMSSVVGGWAGVKLFGSYSEIFNEGGRAVGLMRSSTHMGVYFALSVLAAQILFLQARSRAAALFWLLSGLLLFIGLMASLSRGALAGWLAGFLFLQYRLRGMPLKAVFGMAILGTLLLAAAAMVGLTEKMAGRFQGMEQENSAQERIPLLIGSFHTWAENPIIGQGMGWKEGSLQRGSHNTYFQVLVESGVVGFMIFISLAWIGIRRVLRRSKMKGEAEEDRQIAAFNMAVAAMLGTILLDGLTHSFDFLMPYWLLLGFGFML